MNKFTFITKLKLIIKLLNFYIIYYYIKLFTIYY